MKNPPPGATMEAGSRSGVRRWALTPHSSVSTLSLHSAYGPGGGDETLVAAGCASSVILWPVQEAPCRDCDCVRKRSLRRSLAVILDGRDAIRELGAILSLVKQGLQISAHKRSSLRASWAVC